MARAMAAVLAGRPIANVLAAYPSTLRTRWYALGKTAQCFFAMLRAKNSNPAPWRTAALVELARW
eukprot:4825845-Lingulodinium_polyedra.AAC.1